MNYKLIFKKALKTPGALLEYLNRQPDYRLINIHPYLLKQIKPMERHYKRTGNDRMLKELKLNIKWLEHRHFSYLNQKNPSPANLINYYHSLRNYIVASLNDNIHDFEGLRPVSQDLIISERKVGIFDPELWDGFACYIEAVEFDEPAN